MHLNPASLRRTLSLVLAGSLLLTVLFVGMLPGLLAIAFSYVASNGIQSLLKLKDNKYVAKPIAFLVALIRRIHRVPRERLGDSESSGIASNRTETLLKNYSKSTVATLQKRMANLINKTIIQKEFGILTHKIEYCLS